MGSFVVYILEWALCLSAFLLLYKMCLSGSTFHRFNRFFLLGSVVVSALLPLVHITASEQMEPIAEVCRLNTEQFENVQMQVTEVHEQPTVGQWFFCLYDARLRYLYGDSSNKLAEVGCKDATLPAGEEYKKSGPLDTAGGS